MRKILLLAGISAVPLLWAPAEAQQTVQVCVHSTTTSSCAPVNTSNGLPVNVVSGGGSGGTSSNFGAAFPTAGTAVGFKDSTGTNMAAGNLTAAGAVKTDSSATTQPISAASLPLPTGASTSANQTAIQGTKAPGTAATNSVLTGGVYNSTPPTLTNGQQASTQFTAAGSTKVLDDNSAALLAAAQGPLPAQSSDGVKIGAVQGTVASGSTADTYPVQVGGRAATAAPTAVTDGQIVRQLYTPEGRVVTAPYSIKETMVRGTTTSTDTAAHTIIASAGGSLKNYITNVECGRTDAGATAITLTFNDSASTVVILPSGGATNIQFTIPLATAAATAFQVTSGTGVSTLYCSAQGYTGL